MKTKKLIYDIDGKIFADANIIQAADEFMYGDDTEIRFAQCLFIHACRLHKKRDPDEYDLIVVTNGVEISACRSGRLPCWPAEYEVEADILSELF